MPVYPGPGQAKLINTNSVQYFFNNESFGTLAAPGVVSVAYLIERRSNDPEGFAINGFFSDVPGSPIGFWVEGAEVDDERFYTPSILNISVLTGTLGFRAASVALYPRYLRIRLNVLTNPVAITAVLSR